MAETVASGTFCRVLSAEARKVAAVPVGGERLFVPDPVRDADGPEVAVLDFEVVHALLEP